MRSEKHSAVGSITPGTEPCWSVGRLSDAALYPEFLLNNIEQQRARGFHEGTPRQNFSNGRILVKVLAAEMLNRDREHSAKLSAADLTIEQLCPGCASTLHGNPRLRLPGRGRNLALSYARTGGWLVVAVSRAEQLLGIDVADAADPAFAPGSGELLDDYAFSPQERSHLQRLNQPQRIHQRANWWSLKEAVAKASGVGLVGEGGIPIVEGDGKHVLLSTPGTRTLTLDSRTPDSFGRHLPDTLIGTLLWAPRSTK
jgi:phosphopantetheinyl transferase